MYDKHQTTSLRARREAVEDLWRHGLSGRAVLKQHAEIVDSYVAECFSRSSGAGASMALVATGGYGRSELFPFSDIDLLLLYDPAAEAVVPQVVEAVFYPLWDTGLEVGHGVRTVEACVADARKDFFFQVALLDARLIAGDRALFTQLEKGLRQDFIEGRRRAFLENMLVHQAERHRRFGEHSYLLEPDIKESRGGLRDLQAMLWTAQVVFGLVDLPAMEEAGLLIPEERRSLEDAWEALIRIRYRLHRVSGRKNDRLYFEHQEQMAQDFGQRDADGMLAVEHFMREVYGHMRTVAVATTLFFEHGEEVLRLSFPTVEDRVCEPGVEVLDGHIHLTDLPLLETRPYLLMRVFAHAARTGLPLHYRTRKLVGAHLHLVDDRLRRSRRMAKAFLEVFQEAGEPLPMLEAMLETGLLTAYIPEFGNVESLAQHDLYHAYTVDRHLLQTVAEVRRLQDEEKGIFMSFASPHILYLAALLHDIGKGRGHGHAERGTDLVRKIGQRLGLAPAEVECLVFLVRYHVFLYDTALRRDLDDEALILRCARTVKDPDRLNMLYLLSLADARATGPAVWTEWKATLLLQLYLKIAHLLERSDLVNPDRIEAVVWMREKVSELLEEGGAMEPDDLPEDYLLSFTPEAVVSHMHLAPELKETGAVVRPSNRGGYWSLLIMAKDRTGLLARICGVLALHNLNVLAAQIFTWRDGTAVDVLDVCSAVEGPYEGQDWDALTQDLNLALGDRLGLAHRLGRRHRSVGRGKPRVRLRRPAKVVIDNDISDFYTITEVYADDRPGLLYDITRTLSECGIDIFRAKIGTKVDQVVDVFYVLDKYGEKIDDPELQEELREALLHVVNNGAG